jgi:hypothetical protein
MNLRKQKTSFVLCSLQWETEKDAMNISTSLATLALLSLLALLSTTPCPATTTTFDDIPNAIASYPHLTNGYQNLNWTNFAAINAIRDSNINGVSGAFYGMVSVSNVAFNIFGDPAEIDARGTNFNFLSAYLTGVWRSNLNVEIRGFNSGSVLYDTTLVVSATSPTLFTLNYLNIDRLTFNATGGQYAGLPGGGDGTTFAMDNFTFEFVPEPPSFLLTGAGALLLIAGLKRKRVT